MQSENQNRSYFEAGDLHCALLPVSDMDYTCSAGNIIKINCSKIKFLSGDMHH